MSGIQLFNEVIKENLIDNTKYLKGRPRYALNFALLSAELLKQEKKRAKVAMEQNVTVPPIMIISVTNRCNLKCKGCYANSQDRDIEDEMTVAQIDRIIQEGRKLGVGIVMLAGGEPLLKEGILDVIKRNKKQIFIMFTNGMLIDEATMSKMKDIRNLVPAFSLEGSKSATDSRRGYGVYDKVVGTMRKMDEEKMLFGSSITVTRENFDLVTSDAYLRDLEATGCRTVFLIEYVPCNGDKELCLTEEQKSKLLIRVDEINEEYSMLPVPLPGDEELFEGCLAAGRGFIHIGSTGALEACPFAPYSDVNVKQIPLHTALQSRLITQIRLNHNMLEESEGGCALFENPEWVEGLIEKKEKRSCSSFL